MRKRFIKYIVIIIVILIAVFLSQGGNFLGKGKSFTFVNGAADVVKQAQAYLAAGSSWLMDRVFPNIAGEVEKRGDMIKEGVEQQKENISGNISESIGEKIKNYFSGITDSILHPGENNNNCNCQNQTAPLGQ